MLSSCDPLSELSHLFLLNEDIHNSRLYVAYSMYPVFLFRPNKGLVMSEFLTLIPHTVGSFFLTVDRM